MANILGIIGYNKKSASVNKLLAAYGNDVIDVGTGAGYGLALNGNAVSMENFLDRVFLQNFNTAPITFNGTAWSREYTSRTMLAKYLKAVKTKNRIFLGNCKFAAPQAPVDMASAAITFPNRVFYPDLFKGSNLSWGIEWGQNGRVTADGVKFTLSAADAPLIQNFMTNGIKVGDPLFITSGNAQLASRYYTVRRVLSPYELEMTEKFPVTATALNFWVGSNWFDVDDAITGLGEHSENLLVLTIFGLSYYTGSQLRRIKDAVGTSSPLSVINKGGFTYYFHGSDPYLSGIYRFNGADVQIISRAIDPFIQGMLAANYDDVVVWEEGNRLRFYLGDLTNTNEGISMTNAVATFDTATNTWSVDPIADVITCATTYITSNRRDTYCGASDSQVLQMADGNSLNTAAMALRLETKVYYPNGSDVLSEIPYIQVIGKQARGIKMQYQLWDDAAGKVGEWTELGELTEDKTELPLKGGKEACGIKLAFLGSDTLENDTYIEKVSIFNKPVTRRMT